MSDDIIRSVATVAMETPQRYLVQLCKHFQHRLPVTQEGASGTIAFSMGNCALVASNDSLLMRAQAANQGDLVQLQDVVARHLLRFAFRQPPEIVWVPD